MQLNLLRTTLPDAFQSAPTILSSAGTQTQFWLGFTLATLRIHGGGDVFPGTKGLWPDSTKSLLFEVSLSQDERE